MGWRTKAGWREEPYWHWAWPYADEHAPQYQHMAGTLGGDDSDPPTLKAAIYLPDPDGRSGWQLHQVYSEPVKPPTPRKLGL